ncbi:MAG: hemerythrin domain-containing protein [Acidobacteriota bacterium]
MKIIHALLGEHAVLRRLLDHCDEGCRRWSLAQVQEAAAELGATLLVHARLEEDLLFPELEPYIPAQAGPLAVAHLEHDEIADTLARIASQQDVEGARLLLRYAIEVTRQHFASEERELFSLADRCLDAPALERIGQRWAERSVPAPA